MALAVAVAGVAGQRRAGDRLAGGRTRHRGGVDQAQLVTEAGSVSGQVVDREGDQGAGAAQPPVVGRGGRQVGEQVSQPATGEPQPAPLGVEPQQHLGDGQADQLGVAELWRPSRPPPGTQQVVDGDAQCDNEGVEVGVHEASLEVDVAFATPTLGALALPVTPPPNSEAII